MRTKALIGLAVLAAGAVTCVAQSNVYSLNIVGYVNVPVQGGNKLTLLSNPLKPSNGNYNITNTIALNDAADGALLFSWAGTAWSTVTPSWIGGFGWDTPLTVQLGEAFFIQSPAAATVTFVGEVETGDATTHTINNSFAKGLSVIANKVPVEERFPGAAVGNDGDQMFTWTGTAWSGDIWNYLAGFGWDNGTASSNTNGPLLSVGSGVVYQNTGAAALNWTRVFNPQ